MEAMLLVNNKDMTAADGGTFGRRDPLTGEVATLAAAAAGAFPSWAALLPS